MLLMSVWNWLTKSLGLLGKPYHLDNKDRKFGEATGYVFIQLESPGNFEISHWKRGTRSFGDGEEFVIALTMHQFMDAIQRAERNPEDVRRFLEERAAQNAVD